MIPAALANARAAAQRLASSRKDITLLCAGTAGEMALEDVLGAAAVIDEIEQLGEKPRLDPIASRALPLYRAIDGPLAPILRNTRGGQNILAAGLDEDIDFAARLNSIDAVGVARGNPLTVTILPPR